jgi:RHS repeat-associated protein
MHRGSSIGRNRYYDPKTGRFTQEDPIGLAGGPNLYGFAAGDPVTIGQRRHMHTPCEGLIR